MAAELRAAYTTGLTLYAHIRNPQGSVWNGSAFETYSSLNYSSYGIALTEQGTSGVYVASFPSAITAAGDYEYYIYQQMGGSPAEGDPVLSTGSVVWNGSAVSLVVPGAMSGPDFRDYVVRIFIRTDKDAQLYEAVTDSVSELLRKFSFDEEEIVSTTTDTISVLGDYKLDLEPNLGLLTGDIVLIDGDQSRPVKKVNKEKFDRLYPNNDSPSAFKARPLHFSIFAGQIWLGPVPDDTGYAYRLNYSSRATTVTAATASVPFSGTYRELLREMTLAKLYGGMEGSETPEALHQAKADRLLKDAINRERENKIPAAQIGYQDL